MPKFEIRAAVYVTLVVDVLSQDHVEEAVSNTDLCAQNITDTEVLEITPL